MNDCSNAEIRDQLPDLVHDRLSVTARAAVVAHVDGCADCRDELELLRGVRSALAAQTPRVDIAYVVGALPRAPKAAIAPARQSSVVARPRRWADWRVAAAVTLLVAGGSSVALLNRAPTAPSAPHSVAEVPAPAPAPVNTPLANSNSTVPAPKAASTVVASADVAGNQDASADVGSDVRFAGLSGAQLQTLLSEIDRLEAVPSTEPEPVAIKVNMTSSNTPNIPEGIP
jgi:hypothetical protein